MSKTLTDKQAQSCENATQPACKCRCGGALHGANRGGTMADGGLDRAFFETLPADDPHYLPDDTVKAQRATERKEAKQRERQIASLRRDIAWSELYDLPCEYSKKRLAELEAARVELDRLALELMKRAN